MRAIYIISGIMIIGFMWLAFSVASMPSASEKATEEGIVLVAEKDEVKVYRVYDRRTYIYFTNTGAIAE